MKRDVNRGAWLQLPKNFKIDPKYQWMYVISTLVDKNVDIFKPEYNCAADEACLTH